VQENNRKSFYSHLSGPELTTLGSSQRNTEGSAANRILAACFILLASAVFCGSARSQEPSATQDAGQQHSAEVVENKSPAREASDDDEPENLRIIVHENLQEMPRVETESPAPKSAESGTAPEKAEAGELGEIIQDSGEQILTATDEFLDRSRKPLIYIQDHVPFFTNRNIIFFGRVEPEVAHYSSGVLSDDSGVHIRRLRLGIVGNVKLWSRWTYKLEFDLTDGESTLSDAYLSYYMPKWGTIRIGNQRVAQTLSGQTSALSIPFMERPLPILAFSLQRRLGLGWDAHWRKFGTNISIFGVDPNEDAGAFGYAARFYFNPTRTQAEILHIGVSVMQLDSDAEARFWARPESNLTDIRLVDTGIFPRVDTQGALGAELAGAKGPWTVRSEFYRASWKQEDRSEPKFNGWYVEASHFLTGETANYRDGKFIRPNILGDKGAWEFGLRYSTVDLNDKGVRGGEETNMTLGVNWYSKIHWRLMGNLIKVQSQGPYGKQNPWIIQFRAQYFF
jgi:phosphate-selective porin OprO/OprP